MQTTIAKSKANGIANAFMAMRHAHEIDRLMRTADLSFNAAAEVLEIESGTDWSADYMSQVRDAYDERRAKYSWSYWE